MIKHSIINPILSIMRVNFLILLKTSIDKLIILADTKEILIL